jgi:hypothetical protein
LNRPITSAGTDLTTHVATERCIACSPVILVHPQVTRMHPQLPKPHVGKYLVGLDSPIAFVPNLAHLLGAHFGVLRQLRCGLRAELLEALNGRHAL